jgi:hypothetical protein
MFGFLKKKNASKMFRGWDVHFDASQRDVAELVNVQLAMLEKTYQPEEILKISNILGYDIENIAVFEPLDGKAVWIEKSPGVRVHNYQKGSATLVKSVRDFDLNYHPVTGEDTPVEVVTEAFEFLKSQSIIVGNDNSADELNKISWSKAHKLLYDKGVVMVHTFEFYELSIITLLIEGKKRGACLFEVNEDGSPKSMPYTRRQDL